MSTTEASKLSPEEHDELCCTYAALILSDAGAAISADNLAKLIAASGNKVAPYQPVFFAKALQGVNIAELFAATMSAPQAVPEEVKEEKVKESKKVAKKEEEKEPEAAMTGLTDIFGDA